MLAGMNIYAIAFLASVVMLALLLVISKNQNITYYLLMFVMVIIANMGYYTLSTAETIETALMGHRLVYLSSVFVPIFLLFSTMKLCRLEIPGWLIFILLTLSTVVLYFAFSVGYRDDYYKSISLGSERGMTYLIKEYGPMHKLFIILLFGSVILTI